MTLVIFTKSCCFIDSTDIRIPIRRYVLVVGTVSNFEQGESMPSRGETKGVWRVCLEEAYTKWV